MSTVFFTNIGYSYVRCAVMMMIYAVHGIANAIYFSAGGSRLLTKNVCGRMAQVVWTCTAHVSTNWESVLRSSNLTGSDIDFSLNSVKVLNSVKYHNARDLRRIYLFWQHCELNASHIHSFSNIHIAIEINKSSNVFNRLDGAAKAFTPVSRLGGTYGAIKLLLPFDAYYTTHTYFTYIHSAYGKRRLYILK